MRSLPVSLSIVMGLLLAAGALALAQSAQPPAGVKTAPAPRGEVDKASCADPGCHPNVKQHDTLHGPVSVDACDACHALVNEEEHIYAPAREGLKLCAFCHDIALENMAVVHEPMNTGECSACHDPHGGPDRMLLKARSAGELCAQCHEDVVGANRAVHGPVAAGACAVCHAPHASPFPGLLAAQGPELCTGCHVTTQAQLETLRVVHGPVADDCQTCHDAHASNHEMMLLEEPQALCLSCHETIEHMVETATVQHAAVTTDRKCLNCHEAHASDYPRILQTDMLTLCFECHDREIEMEDGRTLANIKRVIETGTSLHGPIAQDNCAACHQIHGGDHFRLLTQEYPPEFYAPFEEESYALCFSCHDAQVVRDGRTTTLTNFRNGDVNLHYLHVNRERKGRTCRACHETHASNKANHIRESVPFGSGGWMLPINFTKRDTGGHCAPGCHVAYTYDREEPVDYTAPARTTAEEAAGAQAGSAAASGGAP
ncbi:MAG: cytochrome c3 family protein [Planctomycetota bacterium]|nr:cytochrome c3 family protein [Planctomycetota bacterium]